MTIEFERLTAAVTEQATAITDLSITIDSIVAAWNAADATAEEVQAMTRQVQTNTTAICAAKDRLAALLGTEE
jgi:transglutaminase/protease-like cytokinesis protein 3